MRAEKKVLDGILPVTTTEAVYIDGTSKTLQDAINNGELGGGSSNVTINGRGQCCFVLRSGLINVHNDLATSGKIKYSFPTNDHDRVRRMFAYMPNGSMKTIDIPDGELLYHQALVYNWTTNTLETRNTQWGNMKCGTDEYVLLFNALGKISGELASLVKYKYTQEDIPVIDLSFEKIDNRGTTQGIILVDDTIYPTSHASDDHSKFDGTIGGKKHNICHMNAPYYNHTKDILIVGNGAKDYSLELKGWLFLNWKNTYNNNAQLDINIIEKVELDFTQFEGEGKAQLCWGEDSSDIVYLMTCDNRVIRKLKLNKTEGNYNGTYEVLNTWFSEVSDIMGGFIYYKGCLYTGVKGQYGIRKMKLCSNGKILNSYIHPIDKIGDMQGLAIGNDYFYAYTDYAGYRINISEINNI